MFNVICFLGPRYSAVRLGTGKSQYTGPQFSEGMYDIVQMTFFFELCKPQSISMLLSRLEYGPKNRDQKKKLPDF